jgi:CPA2 family monovalent cation:H+ antiporter-2
MPHDVTLITTVALAFALAFVFGVIANGFRLPPLVGYLVAGIAVGPFSPGFSADAALAGQLAEIGVMLLMFGVGLHFSIPDLMAVRRIAIPGAIGQILVATALGAVLAMGWGWSFGGALVLGLSLSVASTVVLLKALEERNAVATPNGRVAVGWLIVEDLAMVLALVLLPAFAEVLGGHALTDAHGAPSTTGPGLLITLGVTLAKVAVFVALALYFGPRVMPWLLRQVARTGSRELFTLGVLALSIGIAFASAKLFGVSFALGAFFAGVVSSESELSHKAAANSLPLQDAFSVLFFVSVGMLFDPTILIREPAMVGAVLLLVLLGKSIAALGIVLVLGYPLTTAISVSAALAQVGEFSFILAGLGASLGLLPPEGLSLILAGAILSITLNPLMFAGAAFLSERVNTLGPLRRFEASRAGRYAALKDELDSAKRRADEKNAAHRSFGPEELVARFPLFEGLNTEQREAFALHFHRATAKPGDRVIRVGDKADHAYFLASGEVEVEVAGRKIRLGPGSFFGEMALLSGKPRSADVTALDFSEFLTLSQQDFRDVLRRYPAIRRQVAALADKRGEMNRQPETGDPFTPPSSPSAPPMSGPV